MSTAGVSGKVVLVTGITSGIGRTVGEVFAERGAKVVGCGRRAEKGKDVERRVRDAGGDLTFVPADVTDRADCIAFVDAAVQAHGRVDVLINNAGGGGEMVPLTSISAEEFDDNLRLNVHSALFCSQRAVEHMLAAHEGGVILNIASVQGLIAIAGFTGYNTAKAALIGLTRSLAVEYLDDGIRANTIIMGGAPTAASAKVASQVATAVRGSGAPAPDMAYLPSPLAGIPLRDVATTLCALADPDMRAVTGAAIAVDDALSAGSLYSEAVMLALSGGWPEPAAASNRQSENRIGRR